MDTKRLRMVATIHEVGSISAAARQLNVAQPALSAQLKELEDHFGTALFHREARGMRATAAGRLLAEHAQQILRAIDRAEEDVFARRDEPSGEVRLGMPFSIAEACLSPLLKEIDTRYPNVRLSFVESFSGTLVRRLSDKRLDLAVIVGAAPDDTLDFEEVAEQRMYLVVPASWSVADQESVRLSELSQLPLILPNAQHGLRRLIESHAVVNGWRLKIRHEIDSAYQLVKLVANGAGATILTPSSVQFAVVADQVRTVPIVEPEVWRKVYVSWPKAHTPDDVTAIVKAELLSVLQTELCTSNAEAFWVGARK